MFRTTLAANSGRLPTLAPRVSSRPLPVSRLRLKAPSSTPLRSGRAQAIRFSSSLVSRSSASSLSPPFKISSELSSAVRRSAASAATATTTLPPNAPLSQRMKHLIKVYGWYAVGVYFTIGLVDFGVAFLGVNLVGAEHAARLAGVVKGAFKDAVGRVKHALGWGVVEGGAEAASGGTVESEAADEMGLVTRVLRTVFKGRDTEALYTMLVLAFGIHKTVFWPVRIGLTAGLTPRLVRWLTRRGWAGGEGTKRAAVEMRDKLRRKSGGK
ncbi:hypothetical protein D9611_007078 [Ephemerocybe angulata]|uniref:DUF1279 domain-containing protein n=1 Tax=Ephemerocybe angulata TaxID=980116 RepID=A0A8H5B1B0_9AGAR|nr:hypothetical protein D9611_007078 [Tulosesus angulatus]